ncbi:hypothetical protein CDV54_07485 [Paracoccus yeei]|nr:hypothetical protein CDV54_07485 [Paracoccus yeei]
MAAATPEGAVRIGLGHGTVSRIAAPGRRSRRCNRMPAARPTSRSSWTLPRAGSASKSAG